MGSIPARWDKQNVFGSVTALPEQLKHAWEEANRADVPKEYQNVNKVIMCGMGGSLLGARVIDSVFGPNLKLPLVLVNDYRLPDWVDEKTLVISSSYSGSTEETLANTRQALDKRAKLAVIANGGKLLEIAKKNNLPYYEIAPKYNPSNQPRMAIGYSVMGGLVLCQKAGILAVGENEVGEAIEAMRAVNPESAEAIAKKFETKQIVLTAAGHLTGAVHTVKNQINENAKHLAHRHDLPELNHHLIEGLGWPKTNSQDTAFWLIDSPLYSARLRQRLGLTKEVVQKNGLAAEVWTANSASKLSQAFELIQLGAFVSFYLSQLHRLDPAAIPWVDYFKKHLGK